MEDFNDEYENDGFEEIEDIIEEPIDDIEVDETSELYNIETSDIGDVELKLRKLKVEEEKEEEEEEEEDFEEEEETEEVEEEFGTAKTKRMQNLDQYEDDTYSTKYIVKSDDRITSEYMTVYEYAMVISTRATHISKGSPIFTKIDKLDDPIEIAKKEIREHKCPLNVVRRLRNGNKIEMWSVNEMIKPHNI